MIWPGLRPYETAEAALFFGREREVADLCQRVERQVCTILCAHSGVGKTSLLQAGLIPSLRQAGFFPIYLRLDHSPGAPSLQEQVWQKLHQANLLEEKTFSSGTRCSLWEWCHDTISGLLSPRNSGVHPVFLFDQFEEIFTIGARREERESQRTKFLDELSDLVENRPPVALRERIAEPDFPHEQFDFENLSYRVLIALREDYLSLLERERRRMPSIMHNRVLLDRLNGEAAVRVVEKPAPELIPPGVAEKIVRYVAGEETLPMEDVQVDPALLSLVCHQLAKARGEGMISEELLRGNRDKILPDFYENAFADLPSAARTFVEENLVTETGHRQSRVKADVERQLGAEVVAQLVDRRILRTEQHGRIAQVELTHDVLVPLVLQSRATRRQRETEARFAVERKQKRRLQQGLIAAVGVALLAVMGLIGSLVFYSASEEKDKELRKTNAELEKTVEVLQTAQMDLESKNLDLETQRQKAELARSEAERLQKITAEMLGLALTWANEITTRASSDDSGLSPAARIALLESTKSLFQEMSSQDSLSSILAQEDLSFLILGMDLLWAQTLARAEEFTRASEKLAALNGPGSPEWDGLSDAQKSRFYEMYGDALDIMAEARRLRAALLYNRNRRAGWQEIREKSKELQQTAIDAYEDSRALAEKNSTRDYELQIKILRGLVRMERLEDVEPALRPLETVFDFSTDEQASVEKLRLAGLFWNTVGNFLGTAANLKYRTDYPLTHRETMERAVNLRRAVLDHPDLPPSWRRSANYDLANSLANLFVALKAEALGNRAKIREALPIYRERVEIARVLHEEDPQSVFYRRFYARGLEILAKELKELRTPDSLQEYSLTAQKLVIIGGTEDVAYLRIFQDSLPASAQNKALEELIKVLEAFPPSSSMRDGGGPSD